MRVVTAMRPNYNLNVAGAERTSIFSWAFHPIGEVNTDSGPSAAGVDPDLEIATTGTTNVVPPAISWLIAGQFTENGTGMGGMGLVVENVGTAATLGSGSYAITVPDGYSGTATPLGIGGSFTPQFRVYAAVGANQFNQDYVFTAAPAGSVLISGTVAEDGTGFSTALLATGLLPTFWSAANGSYGIAVDSGYSGTIRPVHIVAGTFVPDRRVYTNVLAPYTDQNYDYSGTE